MSTTLEPPALLSTSAAARSVGCSASLLVRLEREGITPPAWRLAGSGRRVYTATQVAEIKAIREQRAAAREAARDTR